jgi:hypothetical protein
LSVDGQQKLQEEFARLQKEDQEFSNANGVDAAIDWGKLFLLLLLAKVAQAVIRFLGCSNIWYAALTTKVWPDPYKQVL